MNDYAKAKGTAIEKTIRGQMQAELSGAGMYFALARAAEGLNLDEVAGQFKELAAEHAAQASFYAGFCGRYPFAENEFWQFVKGLSQAEYFGEKAIKGLAAAVKEAGFAAAAGTIETFAAQHRHHAEVTQRLTEKYASENIKQNAEKRYVCGVCGYVYEGELADKPDDFTCPLCGMPKSAFKPKE